MSNELLQKAIELAKAQNREAAIPLLVHIVKAEPENSEAWNCLLDMLADDQRRAVLSALVHKNLGGPAASEVLHVISAEDLKPYLASTAPEVERVDPGDAAILPSENSAGEWLPENEIEFAQGLEPAQDESGAAEQVPYPGQEETAPEAPQDLEGANASSAVPDEQPEPAAEGSLPEAVPESPAGEGRDALADLLSLSASGQVESEASAAVRPEPDGIGAAPAAQPEPVFVVNDRSVSLDEKPGPVLSAPITRRARRRSQGNCLILGLVMVLILVTVAVVLAVLFQNGLVDLSLLGFAPAAAVSATEIAPAASAVPAASATLEPSPVPSATLEATSAPSPAPTSTQPPQPTPTSTAFAGQVLSSAVDGASRVYIPAGTFLMGWNFGDPGETTEHKVNLNAFWIDLTEVTNQMYAACVTAGTCSPPAETKSYKREAYYASAEFASYPVVYVNWQQAADYCAWAGRRLPSEAEWEYAARGDDKRLYPWGKGEPTRELANYNFYNRDTSKVGSFPAGASPFGALDMAGNVAEWVNDWYVENYYGLSPLDNPPGPQQGMVKAFRGGSFANQADKIRSSRRTYDTPTYVSSSLGFRCAQDAP